MLNAYQAGANAAPKIPGLNLNSVQGFTPDKLPAAKDNRCHLPTAANIFNNSFSNFDDKLSLKAPFLPKVGVLK